jgi:hypothetical protein
MLSMWTRGARLVEQGGILATRAGDWLLDLVSTLNQAALRKQIASASNQTAAIATTAISLGDTVPAGYYRVSVYLRLNRAATTSSSLTPTIGWTENAVAKTKSGTAYTGNVTSSCADPFSIVIKIDTDTDITYAVAYASVGGTAARFDADVIVERLPEMPS